MSMVTDFDFDEILRDLGDLSEYEDISNGEEDNMDQDFLMDYGPSIRKAKESEGTETHPLGSSSKDTKDKDMDVTESDIMNNVGLLYPEKKVYRSLILDLFTQDQMIEFEQIQRNFRITNNQKIDIYKEKLAEWGKEFSPIGSGTNRYAFMHNGYIVKVACDGDGKIDNKREYIYSMALQPYVIKCYEILPDGLLAVFEYVEVFTIDDFWKNKEDMRKILEDIASNFLIGDVGTSSKNYTNWGYREDELVILDFAYIYSVAFKTFTCSCSPTALLHYDNDFCNLICSSCGKKYTFPQIRKKITKKEQSEEIGDIMQKGYILSKPEEVCKTNPKFIIGAMEKIGKKLMKIKKKENEKLKEMCKDDDFYEDDMEMDEILEGIMDGTIQ